MNECHFNEAAEVQRGFFKSCEDAAGFFEPADQPLDDVAPSIRFAIEFDGTFAAVFVVLGGNDRLDARRQEIVVDPIGAISLVASRVARAKRRDRPSPPAAARSARLPARCRAPWIRGIGRRQMEMQRMPTLSHSRWIFVEKPPRERPNA